MNALAQIWVVFRLGTCFFFVRADVGILPNEMISVGVATIWARWLNFGHFSIRNFFNESLTIAQTIRFHLHFTSRLHFFLHQFPILIFGCAMHHKPNPIRFISPQFVMPRARRMCARPTIRFAFQNAIPLFRNHLTVTWNVSAKISLSILSLISTGLHR